MTRLDEQINHVRNKLTLQQFVSGAGWLSMVLAGVAVSIVVFWIVTGLSLPHLRWFIGLAVAIVVVGAVIWAGMRRPSALSTAVMIDQKLGLQEKFATAIFIRNRRSANDDPFAQAAVNDAEQSAQQVILQHHFSLVLPRSFRLVAALVALAVLLCFIPSANLLKRPISTNQPAAQAQQVRQARQIVQDTLVKVQAIAQNFNENKELAAIQSELRASLADPPASTSQAHLKAMQALQSTQQAIQKQLEGNARLLQSQQEQHFLQALQPSPLDQGPLAASRYSLATGNFDQAMQQLNQVVASFDQMDEQQKEQTVQEMQQMAQALEQPSKDSQNDQPQSMKQQLAQAGASPEQIDKISQSLQQAAQGDSQAAQEARKQSDALQQQVRTNPNLTPEQSQAMQEAIGQTIDQSLARAGAEAQTQKLAQTTRELAQQMQQASNSSIDSPQPPNSNQSSDSSEQLHAAQQALTEQLRQMQAAQNDLQQAQTAQNAATAAAQQAMELANADTNGTANQSSNQLLTAAQHSDGSAPQKQNQQSPITSTAQPAPRALDIQRRYAPSAYQDQAPLIAGTLLKDRTGVKGESRETFKNAVISAQQQVSQEIQSQAIPPQSRQAVKNYFDAMQQDAD
ncbi:MAG: hypothetical protein IT448_06560 [Phycisphaerales bacterium]|nr:hypothetical protein [Phycisphaerales bacterium]